MVAVVLPAVAVSATMGMTSNVGLEKCVFFILILLVNRALPVLPTLLLGG